MVKPILPGQSPALLPPGKLREKLQDPVLVLLHCRCGVQRVGVKKPERRKLILSHQLRVIDVSLVLHHKPVQGPCLRRVPHLQGSVGHKRHISLEGLKPLHRLLIQRIAGAVGLKGGDEEIKPCGRGVGIGVAHGKLPARRCVHNGL